MHHQPEKLFTDKQVIIFDFDGTLVDVSSVIVKVFNTLAPEYEYAPMTPEELPTLRNLTIHQLLRSRMNIAPWQWFRVWRFTRRARTEYEKHRTHISLFPHIPTLFETLTARGYRIGIVSSNTRPTIHRLLATFGLNVDFVETSSLFGKAKALKRVLTHYNLSPEQVLYLGDEIRDIEACRAAGIDILAVTWGLNSKESLAAAGADTLEDPLKLLDYLPDLHQQATEGNPTAS